MTGIDKPLYLVTMKDQWVTHKALLSNVNALPAFGTRADAEKWMHEAARDSGTPLRFYRVVEFTCSDVLAAKT